MPRLYGHENAKCVARIELVTDPWVGYRERFGYTIAGEVDPARLRDGHLRSLRAARARRVVGQPSVR